MDHKIMNCPHYGKIITKQILNPKTEHQKVTCSECGSQRNCKDGMRHIRTGKIQRYLCWDCGYRFS